MTHDAGQHDGPATHQVSRRALLAATAPAALLYGAARTPVAQAGILPGSPTSVPLPPCACGTAAGPMRVVGWSAHRLP